MKFLFLSFALFCTGSAHAALPPFYESVRELRAILDNADVAKKLGSGSMIDSINRNDTGFEIVTSSCMLQVGVRYLPPEGGIAGPAKFVLEVGDATCLPR